MSDKFTSLQIHRTSDLEKLERLAEAKGFKKAPKDPPIYSEGSSIMFLKLRPKQSQKHDTVTLSLTHRSRSIK